MPAYNAGSTIADESVAGALAQGASKPEPIIVDDDSDQPVVRARNPSEATVHSTLASQSSPSCMRTTGGTSSTSRGGWPNSRIQPSATRKVLGQRNGFDRWIKPAGSRTDRHGSVPGSRLHHVNDLAGLYLEIRSRHPGVAMPAAAVRAVGRHPGWLTVVEDFLLALSLRKAGWQFSYVDRSSAIYRWPNSMRGARFNRRRNVHQQAKLFAALVPASPGESPIRARLAGEMIAILARHVPRGAWRAAGRRGSLTASRVLRERPLARRRRRVVGLGSFGSLPVRRCGYR